MSRQQPVIKYKKWACRKISMSVGVMQQPSRNRINEALSSIPLDTSGISETRYKMECVPRFIMEYQKIEDLIYKESRSQSEIKAYKESLFSLVKAVNKTLNPNNIHITDNNTLTTLKTDYPVTECPSWDKKEEVSEHLFDTEMIYRATDRAETCNYRLHSEKLKLLDITISVKEFKKADKVDLIIGFEPKNNQEKKLFFVCLCVDNLHAIKSYVESNPETQGLRQSKVVESLYELVTKHNPWVKMRTTEFRKINKEYSTEGREAVVGEKLPVEAKTYKCLSKVPKKKILSLEEDLKSVIFGQDPAIESICKTIKKAYAGLNDPNSPIGVFFLYGGTSVGKTETARELADRLTGSKSNLVKIDCNNLQQDHDMSVLLGAPPSYVGFEEGGILSSQLEDSSFKVILFDEVEKASNKLFDYILNFIDEGKAFDKKGNLLDFSNCIFILTSNVGQKEANKSLNGSIGFKGSDPSQDEKLLEKEYSKSLKKLLKPEMIARLNIHGGMFYYRSLNRDSLNSVANRYLENTKQNLLENNIHLLFDTEVVQKVVDKALVKNSKAHSRDVINTIQLEVLQKVSDLLIDDKQAGKGKKEVLVIASEDDDFHVEYLK